MDKKRATLQDRHETTVVSLQRTAETTQPKLVNYLDELKSHNIVKDYKTFWIRNIIRVDTYQSVADKIARRDDVLRVYPNYEIKSMDHAYHLPTTKNYTKRYWLSCIYWLGDSTISIRWLLYGWSVFNWNY